LATTVAGGVLQSTVPFTPGAGTCTTVRSSGFLFAVCGMI